MRTRPINGGTLNHPILPDVPPEPTAEQKHAAMLTVAHHAHTVDDCRQLLDALGLLS